MTRHPSARRRPNFDVLERRALLAGQWTVGLPSALGLGATGKYAAIHSNAVATDPAGDTIITGSFRGSVGFDPHSVGSTLATNNTQDTFVAKYSPSGSLLWARSFVGQATQVVGQPTTYAVAQGSALAVDLAGNILVAGSFSGTVAFGAGANPTTLASPNGTEAFAAKLDGSGNLLWASSAVAIGGDDSALAVVADGSGGAIVAGSYAQGVSLGGTVLAATGASEAFVAHLDMTGKFTWAVGSQGSAGSNAGARGLARDGSGNVVVAGFIAGSVGLGGGTSVTGAGSDDAAVWKLDATGHFLWARSWGSPDYDAANSVAVDPSGNILTTGAFSDSVNFATGLTSATLTAGASFDTFVVKLDPSGNELWAKGFVGPDGWAVGSGIAVDSSGNSHIAGSFRGTVDFDPGPNVANLVSVGYTDLFVAGLDSSGNLLYAIHAGQTNSNEALGIAATTTPGTVAITGTYSGAIVFGTTTLPSTATTAVFAARVVAQSPPPATLAAPVPEPASITGTNNTTSVTSPTFDENGADPADTVRLLRDGTAVGQRLGPGAITDPGPVLQGTHAYTAIQISPSGTPSLASPATTITVLTTPPPAPGGLGLVAADDSGTVGDGITNVRQPRLSGHAAAGTTVQVVTSAGVVVGSTTAGSDGSFTAKLNAPLADGSYSLQARSIDLAGNISPPGPKLALVILTAPTNLAAPALAAADDTGVAGDGMTTVRRPRIAGTGTPGGRIDWLAADGTVLASTTAAATGGAYLLQAPTALANGVIGVRVRETDVAGNVGAISPTLNLTVRAAPGDYFGDSQTDVAIFRPSANTFYIQVPTTGQFFAQNWAIAGDVPVSGDFFGDGHGDLAVYRPSTSTFYVYDPATQAVAATQWGGIGSIPVPGDYDGDGKTDVAIFWPATATFYVQNSTTNTMVTRQFGISGDIPVPADYFGDGHTDFAVYRPSTATFYILDPATNAFKAATLGQPGDVPVPADYEGVGHADLAVYRPSNLTYYIQFSTGTNRLFSRTFGVPGDVPVLGDYFGAGRSSLAVYRPSNSTFYALDPITNAFRSVQWGVANTDKPILPPITASFTIGGFGPGRPFVVFPGGSGPRFAVAPPVLANLVEVDSPDPTSMTSIDPAENGATTLDHAIETLSLDRWRIGR